jgi:hypothetical protein
LGAAFITAPLRARQQIARQQIARQQIESHYQPTLANSAGHAVIKNMKQSL